METIEHVVRPNNTLCRRQVIEHDIPIQNQILQTLLAGTPIPVPSVFQFKELGIASLVCKAPLYFVSCRLPALPLKTAFHAVDKLMLPVFSSDKAPMSLSWVPPKDMDLRFIVGATYGAPQSNYPTGYFQFNTSYLLAFSSEKRCYKLPMPNIYADGRLCLGNSHIEVQSTLQDVYLATYRLFCDAPWGTDLWDNIEITQKLIRLEPTKDGFKSLPPDGDWKAMSAVVANELITMLTPTL